MKELLTQLFKVKTLITLILTTTFAILSIRGQVPVDRFIFIFTTVIAFYFGSQSSKKDSQ